MKTLVITRTDGGGHVLPEDEYHALKLGLDHKLLNEYLTYLVKSEENSAPPAFCFRAAT